MYGTYAARAENSVILIYQVQRARSTILSGLWREAGWVNISRVLDVIYIMSWYSSLHASKHASEAGNRREDVDVHRMMHGYYPPPPSRWRRLPVDGMAEGVNFFWFRPRSLSA